MGENRESLTFTRWLGIIMLVAVVILAVKKLRSEPIALEFVIRGITALSFGLCCLLLSFQWKITGTAFGIITLLSLPAVDVVHYFRHKSSFVDALIPSIGAFVGLGLLLYILLRKKTKDSDVA